jgi:hypothetical protein
MKKDSLHLPGKTDPVPDPEIWISRQEVKRLFPDVQDRQLKYWRDSKKIRSKTVRNQTWYIESEVRAMTKLYSRPLKYVRSRAKWLRKKLPTINPVLAIAVLTILFLFAINKSYFKKPVYDFWDFATPFLLLLFFCFIYGFVKLIEYLWQRIFPRKQDNE